MASVEFLGVGDATDFEQGQTSVLFRGSCRLLIDCGPQIPLAVSRRLESVEDLDGIYVTHLHADHCFGLPSLLLWLRQNGRQRPLTLLAETTVLAAILRLIDAGYPDAFAASKCFAIEHVALAVRSSLPWMGTILSIAPTLHSLPNFALRIDDAGTSCAFSGDGLYSAQTAEIYTDLRLLIHECAYLDRVSSSHTSARKLIELGHQVRPRQLFVTHMDRKERAKIQANLVGELGSIVSFPEPGMRRYLDAE